MAKRARKATGKNADDVDQLSVRIPRTLHHRLQEVVLKRKQASDTLATQGEIVGAALTEWFEKHDGKRGG